jgi:hypothetical protein
MPSNRHSATSGTTTLALSLVVIAISAITSPLRAEDLSSPAMLEGRAVDANGHPLSATERLTLTYYGASGQEVYAEIVEEVEIVAGRFEIALGTGDPITADRSGTLESVFATHPELELEVMIGSTLYGPRSGILPAGHSLKSRLVAAGVRSESDDEQHWKGYDSRSGATAVQSTQLAPVGGTIARAPQSTDTVRRRPYTLPVVGPGLSRPVRELPIAKVHPLRDEIEVNRPRHETLFDAEGNRFGTVTPKVDDYLRSQAPVGLSPALNFDFAGIDNVNGVLPPDTEGAVGPGHYVQVVNLSFAVFDKGGNLVTGPSNTNALWAGFGGPCQTDNSGDAIFLYDQQADRFVLSQFAVAGSHHSVCFAVSQTADPTGSYYLYEVVTPRFPDYYKVGVWPDPDNNAYFFGTNSGFQGQYDVFAVDRASMLAGAPTRPMQFFQNFVNLMMPADVDGPSGPPTGSPGIFYTFRDGGEPYFSNPPSDSIDIWQFDVDWNTPANSTFSLIQSITPAQGLADFNWTVCGFFVSNCIPQPGTAQGIDSASWWPMQRLVYRNFGSHETLVGSWTVDVLAAGNRAAPRWFELRDAGGGWTMYQQGTHSPDAIHRWMPSIAMDGSGNLALGYSRGNGSNFPSIYYATRDAGDPLGTLQAEALLFAGSGSQTHSAARWGDYSSMELDPADDCTFWYTTEYLATTGSAPWRTRVGTFTLPGCGGPPVASFGLSCIPASHTIQQGADAVSTCTVTSVNGFTGAVDLSCSGQPAGTSCSFAPATVSPPAGGSATSTLTLSIALGQATGTYIFDIQGVSGALTKTSTMNVDVIPEGSNGPQEASFDPAYQAPACLIPGSSCDSVALLDGRANLGPEPNQPNTINDSCADGTSGSYHNDESNDRIVVSTLDDANFSEGATVRIDATLWAWSSGSADTLDLYYAANAASPSWVYITSIVPPAGGSQTLSAQYTLPTGDLQAVRANFRYQGSASPCSTGTYDDHDDLVFAVETGGPECTIDADCDDGLFCNGAETCSVGVCQTGTAPSCSDSVSCTVDSCNEGTDSCDNVPNDALCDNGLFCDGAETCDPVNDCQAGTPPSCGDSVGCTVDSCNETTDSCDNVPDDGLCDNGLFCDGAETCDPVLDCQTGSNPCPGQSCDEGGDVCVGGGDAALWMSFRSNTTIPGIGTVADEDIVSFDEGSGLWTFEFDGSDVGLGSLEIDGMAILPDGDLLLSFTAAGTVGGLAVDDSDIVRFTPTSLGTNTAGTFSIYFDGSDVGLTSNGEDVDSIALAADGRLIISTAGSISAIGASGRDEDLWIFTGTLGASTSGSFALYFDGSDVGLSGSSSEDVDAATLTTLGDLLFSTVGDFSVAGLSGTDEDVAEFSGSFGPSTSGSFILRLDLSALGIDASEDVGSLHLVE